MAIEGGGKAIGKEPAPLDAFGHVVREASLAEDGKAEKVDVDLSNSSPSAPRWFRPHFHTSLGSMPLTPAAVKEYNGVVSIARRVSDRLPDGAVDTTSPSQHSPLNVQSGGVFRFWRWLSCGHGHHHWTIQAALDLGGPPYNSTFAIRHCPRCDATVVIE